MIPEETIKEQLKNMLTGTDFTLGKRYEGKVRDNYTIDGKRIIITTDRVSAFDRVLGSIPFKGEVLTEMAMFWFDKTKDIVPNHVINMPDPNVIIGHECEALPVEAVVRAYNTGSTTTSVWYAYEQGKREFCGNTLPDGMKKNERFPQPIFTPSTKAEKGGHDESVSKEEIVKRGALSKEMIDKLEEVSMKLFALGTEIAAKQGIILVDTKYEFGMLNGELVLIDEIHTPDSSRFWFQDEYETRLAAGEEQKKIDKEYLRLWLSERGFIGEGPIPDIPDEIKVEAARRYIQAFELITGETFKATQGDPIERIRGNLKQEGYEV